jgi:hypothetical protein
MLRFIDREGTKIVNVPPELAQEVGTFNDMMVLSMAICNETSYDRKIDSGGG